MAYPSPLSTEPTLLDRLAAHYQELHDEAVFMAVNEAGMVDIRRHALKGALEVLAAELCHEAGRAPGASMRDAARFILEGIGGWELGMAWNDPRRG